MKLAQVQARLAALAPTINELLHLSGSAGVSVGVLHHNQVIHTANFGYSNIAEQTRATSDTLYWVGSIAKPVTAAGIGLLVQDGKLQWDTLVSEILPDFQHEDDTIREKATVLDLLSHRSGLGGKNGLWQRDHCRLMISREDFVKTATYLRACSEPGETWSPSNWNYGLADTIIERLSGMSHGAFLKSRLFEPLGLHRTTTDVSPNMDNVAEAYLFSGDLDKQPSSTHKPQIGDGTIMPGAMGLKSSVNDLLSYCEALMGAWSTQEKSHANTSAGSPFAQTTVMMAPHIPVTTNPDGTPNAQFCLGWVRTRLPNPMSEMGINEFYVDKFPTIGKGLANGPEVFYSAGSMVGYLTSVTLIPGTSSSIVVLSNTLGNQDLPDWIGLLLLEALLDVPDPIDFIPYAMEAGNSWALGFPQMKKALDEGRNLQSPMRQLATYVGRYWNKVHTWYFDIFQEGGNDTLWMAYCGDRDSKYLLTHYRDDILTFEIDYEESKRRGLWPVPSADFYLLRFQNPGEDGRLQEILWKADWQEPEGEVFKRSERNLESYSLQQPLASL